MDGLGNGAGAQKADPEATLVGGAHTGLLAWMAPGDSRLPVREERSLAGTWYFNVIFDTSLRVGSSNRSLSTGSARVFV